MYPSSEKKGKSNTLQTMGLRAFVDETRAKQGGYAKLDEMFRAGDNNTKIGRHFDRSRQTIASWRAIWEADNE